MKSTIASRRCIRNFTVRLAVAPRRTMLVPLFLIAAAGSAVTAAEDSRTRSARRDRGTYQAPTVPAQSGQPAKAAELVRPRHAVRQVAMQDSPQAAGQPTIMGPTQGEVIPVPRGEEIYLEEGTYDDPGIPFDEQAPFGSHETYGGYVGGEVIDGGCDGLPPAMGLPGCGVEGEYIGEPSCGISSCDGCDRCSSSGWIPFPQLCNNQWFGSAEWLLWYRRGQDFPVLAATATSGTTAGQPLFGGSRAGEDEESGLRLSVGTWLDQGQCQAVTARFWGMDEESIRYRATGDDGITVVRPFLNVTTGTGTADEYVAVRPNTRDFLDIDFSSELYGGDASLRQLWVRGLGGRIDWLYGYQYLRLDENLAIRSRTSGTLDSVQTIEDQFDVENEFHGAQVGLAVHYDERCWSFDGLAKLGFGSLQRRAALSGVTTNLVPPAVESTTVPGGGLLVRSTNEGSTGDGTFAVVPEISLGLGYQMTRCVDLSVGYSFIMVTDALQASQTLDDRLAVNLEDPPVSPASPSRSFSYNDYWVQGIQFGLNVNY